MKKLHALPLAFLALLSILAGAGPANAYNPPETETVRPQIDGAWQATFTPSNVTPGGYMNDHTILKAPDGRWHLIGISGGGSGHETSLAHGVSDSLSGPWTELAPVAAYTDEGGKPLEAWAPSAIVRDGVTYLFYRSNLGGTSTLALDTSSDPNLATWHRHLEVSMTGIPAADYHFRDPMVVQDGAVYRMYFTASWNGRSSIGMATSSDLIHWEYQGAALTTSGSATDVSWSAAESPFVYQIGQSWYLAVTLTASTAADYHETFVFRSSDPSWFGDFNGDPATTAGADVVAQLPVHAAEFVNDDGQWYITTAGWAGRSLYPQAKTGVAIAPLRFDQLAPGKPASAEPDPKGLLAYYPFEDTAAGRDRTVADASGNGHTATLSGSAQEVGQRGSSRVVTMSPTGAGQVDLPAMTLDGDFTIAAWINPSTTVDNNQGLFTLGEGIDINAYAGRLRFHADKKDVLTAPFAMPKNQWTHVALTRHDGVLAMYVNGSLVASGGTYTGSLTPGPLGVTISGRAAASYDDVLLYNRALTGSEIACAMGSATTTGTQPVPPNPTAPATTEPGPTPDPSTAAAIVSDSGASAGLLAATGGVPRAMWLVFAVLAVAIGASVVRARRHQPGC